LGKVGGKVIKIAVLCEGSSLAYRLSWAAGCGTACQMLSTYPVILEKTRGAGRAADASGGGDEAVSVDSGAVLSLPPLLQPS